MSFDLTDWLGLAEECRDRARVKRTRGDALLKLGNIEEATRAFRAAARDLRKPLDALPDTVKAELLKSTDVKRLDELQQKVVAELVELYGSLGGTQRRTGDHHDALSSYEQGSRIEQQLNLASTYNRLNAIKYKLITRTATLDEMENDLKKLEHHIDKNLTVNSELSDSGWAWADLGDCRLLAGDLEGARSAYQIFVSKAETKSPVIALGVLSEVACTLESATGARALQARENIEQLKREFA